MIEDLVGFLREESCLDRGQEQLFGQGPFNAKGIATPVDTFACHGRAPVLSRLADGERLTAESTREETGQQILWAPSRRPGTTLLRCPQGGHALAYRRTPRMGLVPDLIAHDAQLRHRLLNPFAPRAPPVDRASRVGVSISIGTVPRIDARVEAIVQEPRAALQLAVQSQEVPTRLLTAGPIDGARRRHIQSVQLCHNLDGRPAVDIPLVNLLHPPRLLRVDNEARPDLQRLPVLIQLHRVTHRLQLVAVHPSAVPIAFLRLVDHPALDLAFELIQKDFIGQLFRLGLEFVSLLVGVDAVAHRNQSSSVEQDALAGLVRFLRITRQTAHVVDQ
ncbi:MAG: hypothetical protein MRJ68_12550 [Nitrospira sp.]|nr:hypothetical protein [Nitrospira sp.]